MDWSNLLIRSFQERGILKMDNEATKIHRDNRRRNLSIDFARILFTFAVFICHTNSLIQDSKNEPLYMCFGFLGVEFFFILSGYLMASKAAGEKKDAELGPATMKFLFHKFKTIFPYYAVAWIIAMLVSHWNVGLSQFGILMVKALPCILQVDIAGFRGYRILGPAWYISALLMSVLILYPMLLHFKKTFSLAIAPTISIFGYGYLFYTVGHLATIKPLEGGVVATGLLRGLAGVSLGCILFEASKALSAMKMNNRSKNLLAIVEILAFGLALFAQRTGAVRPDFLFLFLVSIGITTGFCSQNILTALKSKYDFVGHFSMCYYLADRISFILTVNYLPEATRDERLPVVIGIATGTALIIMAFGNLLKRAGATLQKLLGTYFLEPERTEAVAVKNK